MFDPEEFGQAMGQMTADAISAAVEPLQRRISDLQKQLSAAPDVARMISDEVKKQLAEVALPRDGKDADMEAITAALNEQVRLAVAAIPAPKDGRDGVDGKDGEAGRDGQNGKDGQQGQRGEPGEQGTPGRDGLHGQNGKSFGIEDAEILLKHHWSAWELEFERRAAVALDKALDRLPKPADGVDGKDGADGLGFDDLEVQHDGGRHLCIKFVRGERVRKFDFEIPVVIDQGIYKEGSTYVAGDGVTWGGSYWIAQSETKAKPDSLDSGWRLAVKKGRDGKDGRHGIDKTAPVRLGD